MSNIAVLIVLLRGLVISAAQVSDSARAGDGAAPDPCLTVAPPCVSDADRFSLAALRHIHKELDDDKDGGIEVNESVEFIIEDMKQHQTNKHSNLHREDQHITVEELWKGWKSSEGKRSEPSWYTGRPNNRLFSPSFSPQLDGGGRRAVVERVGGAAPVREELPGLPRRRQHASADRRERAVLPVRAAQGGGSTAQAETQPQGAGRGPFRPTRPQHNWIKDFVLVISIVIGVGGCWFAYLQNKSSKVHLSQMMKDLESLQRAEQSLLDLQSRLEKAQEENRTVVVEKQNLERKMRDEITGAKNEASRLRDLRQGAESELSRLKYAEEELVQVRKALRRAEKEMLSERSLPEALQKWLQLTHEVEVQYYNVKKQSAELQLCVAKDEAEKIKKKRGSIFGTLHVAHSSSLDEVDHKILEAKKSLSEVTACLRERLHRWQQIERLCAFPVVNNSGLPSLTASLYSDHSWVVMPRVSVPPYPVAGGVDDLDEDTPPIVPQFTTTVMRPPLTRNSGSCRSRRSLACAPSAVSPDLLSSANSSLSRRFELDDQRMALGSDQRSDAGGDTLDSSAGRVTNPDAPYRKISREELLLFHRSRESPASGGVLCDGGDSLPPSLPPAPSGPPSTSPSPDLTRVSPETVTPLAGKRANNGVLEKSYSFGALPAGAPPAVGRYPSLASLDSEGRSVGRERKLPSASSQDSSDNGEKFKRSSSKIKSLFKKRK
ncbi:stromal interaction molecule 2 isoform X1 [Stigmatopora argus]